jgi:hypothetical protein
MIELETWLRQATRYLSRDSASQVRAEIREHYESAREAPICGGSTADEADRLALAALGNAKAANREYRSVLLTSQEARVLGEGNWEARAVCSRSWLKWLLPAIPVVALFAAVALFSTGAITVARVLLVGATGMGVLSAAPFLPLYTPSRSRIFRLVKWIVLIGTLGLAFGADALKWSWLLISCLGPLAWTEWTRVSIRRKLPVALWPKQLYL